MVRVVRSIFIAKLYSRREQNYNFAIFTGLGGAISIETISKEVRRLRIGEWEIQRVIKWMSTITKFYGASIVFRMYNCSWRDSASPYAPFFRLFIDGDDKPPCVY